MAYDEPTTAQFIKRFPEFEDVEKPILQTALDDATASISTTWYEPDYAPAIMFLAAHYLTMAQQQGLGGVPSSVNLGPISLSYARDLKDPKSFYSTAYGQRFNEIRDRNVGGLVVVI